MTQHWQELLPIDRYMVAANGLLHEYDRKILTFLYQPLIGAHCLSLYMTLWAELEENRLWSESHSHHSLMNFMDSNLKSIYEMRLKLEAIGLLKTYVKESDEGRSFIYELQPPLTPEQFLQDGMLNIYLYRKIGRNQYNRIRRFFSEQPLPDQEYKQITKAFQDVFESNHSTAYMFDEETILATAPLDDQEFIGRKQTTEIKASDESFNFELLLTGLHDNLVPKEAFTKKVKEAVSSLAFLYGIDALEMKNIVISALDADNEINIEELRKSARDWYQFQHDDSLPALSERTQPAIHQTAVQEPKTQEEKLIYYFDHTSPVQFLRDISGGTEPSRADIKMIEDIMFQQKLLPGVVNVLIDMVMRQNDMKLMRNYVEKIAAQWARKEIKTVRAAMELAKQEYRKNVKSSESQKKPRTTTAQKKPIRTEKLPDWFDKEPSMESQPKQNEDEQKVKKQEIEEMLKKLRS